MANTENKRYNLDEIRKAIRLLFSDVRIGDGECVEVRMMNKKKNLTVSGWFDDFEMMAKAVARAARDGFGTPGAYRFIHENIFWTCNPVDDALLSRQPKNTLDFVSENTSDNNVTRRIWMIVDIDPLRPSGVSATKEEKKLALDVANLLMQKLEELGFTNEMIVGGSSGNGYHILIRIDIPNDEESRDLIRDCLRAMQSMVGTGKVEIDPKVFNAARIIKCYGTMACKGVDDEKRPWRMAGLTIVPKKLVPATKELLQKLAGLAPTVNTKRAVQDRQQGPWTEENLQKYLDEGTEWQRHRVDPKKNNEVARWIGNCVFDPNHKDAAIILHTDGWWSYGCFHASCDKYRHEEFKRHWAEQCGPYEYPGRKKLSYASIVSGFDVAEGEIVEEPRAKGDEIPPYNLTDAGNMERLVWRYKDRFLYCPQRDWYAWDGRRWVPDATNSIICASLATVRKLHEEIPRAIAGLDPNNENDEKKISAITNKYLGWQQMSESKVRLTAMSSLAESFVPVEMHRFDSDLMLFNVLNGTIDLHTGELRPHARENFITNVSPVVHDPKAECPLWLEFLNTVTAGNQELINFLQRAVGYSLTGLTVEHCLFLLYGNGRNGKTTFIEVIRYLLGTYGTAASMDTFIVKPHGEGIPNDLAALQAARFVSAVESEDGKRLAEAKIKQVTGGDTITARFLHKEFFNFTPQFKIWLGTNHRPVIHGTDEGIWRRIRLVPFDVYIPDGQVDEKLREKLISEASGILNWALAGLEEYRQNGLMEPDIVTGATEEYRSAQDWLSRFLEETTEPSETESVGARALYEKYKEWAHNVGESVLKEAKFADAMKAKMGKPQRLRMPDGKQVKSYVGVKFRQHLANWRPSTEVQLEDVDSL